VDVEPHLQELTGIELGDNARTHTTIVLAILRAEVEGIRHLKVNGNVEE
jgi:hypothetical protein